MVGFHDWVSWSGFMVGFCGQVLVLGFGVGFHGWVGGQFHSRVLWSGLVVRFRSWVLVLGFGGWVLGVRIGGWVSGSGFRFGFSPKHKPVCQNHCPHVPRHQMTHDYCPLNLGEHCLPSNKLQPRS